MATNDKELNELIRRGEKNIVKFNVNKKTKGFQKVGDISLLLKNADPKKNKFTLQVQADDKLTEKKDRNINEPLQFYVSNSLYEIVVNTVGKDTCRVICRRRNTRRGIISRFEGWQDRPALITESHAAATRP